MNYEIYTTEDPENLSDQLESMFQRHSNDFKPSLLSRGEDASKVVENYSNGGCIVYAESNHSDIIGFLAVDPSGTRDPIEQYCPCYYVNIALVNDEHRGQGIGTALLSEAIDNLLDEESPYLGLRTRADNKTMQSVVESIGFQNEGSEYDNGYKRLYYIYEK